ncbi:HXXEE domain-containing protein [Methyloferula stellata]|uniref:HXXEE domain-containing protein n=1 Tax=Methyloferula stellata TaxID=876270 RepID=UPI0005909734|nr:HXXEE domain-containing protein [Methyloferula stellata]
MTHWLSKYWVQGALFMAVALLALVPLIFKAWWPQILLIYLHSPGYMVHQVEEHTGDRFRTFINQRLFGGVEALTTVGVLWINLPGVWGINLAALYAAVFLEPGYALAAPYLMIVNAVAHLGTVKRTHGYNPGLVTALIVFFPLGLVTLYMVPASLGQHLLGLGISIAIHATIAGGAITRAAYLRRAQLQKA